MNISSVCKQVISLASFLAIAATPAVAVDCSIADTAVKEASRIRGLRIKRNVPCKLQDRDEVMEYLRKAVREKIPPGKLENEERAYKALGLLPLEFDYVEGLLKLYTSQLGGYYDPTDKYYAMAAWMPGAMQMPIAVHELTHALQDQYYDLDKLLDHVKEGSDTLLARSALAEGDATAVMMDFTRAMMGQGSIAEEKSVSGMMMQNIAGAMLSSAMTQAPSSLQAILIFPYISGLNFAHALLKENGYRSIDDAFRRLPSSTEEILHPDKYLNKEKDYVELDAPAAPEGIELASPEPVYSDVIGEFIISVLLGGWIPPAEASVAAAGWGGDRVVLYKTKRSDEHLAVWETRWDSEKDAKEFFTALSTGYAKRFGKSGSASAVKFALRDSNFGRVEISRANDKVTVVIGG